MADYQQDTFTIPRQAKRTQLREEKPCSISGCEGVQWSRGYCSRHYTKLRKSGALEKVKDTGFALDRFNESYVISADTGCWLWKKAISDKGYGIHTIGMKPVKAHRYAFEQLVGNLPAEAMVLHRCDNPACVNPEHLFLGDNGVNMRDCVAKGRHYSHKGQPLRVLTPAMVWNIRIMFARAELSMRQMAKIYGVEVSTISNCLTGRTHQ